MRGISKKIALGSAVLALAVPASALAQESVVGGYSETEVVDPNDPGTKLQDPSSDPSSEQTASHNSNSSSGGASDTQSSEGSGGSLPFTGLDVGLLALAGGGLVALGFGMRRLTRNPDTV